MIIISINKIVLEALKPLNVPVELQVYEGKEETYITFSEYLEQGENFSDDLEEITGHYIQVDLWSKGNLESLKEEVVSLLTKNNFIKQSITNLYEPDTKIFHKCLRFFFYESKEED